MGFGSSQVSPLSSGAPGVESLLFPGGILGAAASHTSSHPHRGEAELAPGARSCSSLSWEGDAGFGGREGLCLAAQVPCCAGRLQFLPKEVLSRLLALSLTKIDWIHPPGTGAPECQIASQLSAALILCVNILPDPFKGWERLELWVWFFFVVLLKLRLFSNC